MEILLLFVFSILLIIVLSGLISGTEAALLSTSYPEAKEFLTKSRTEKEVKKAERLLSIKDSLQDYITTIVILNNIVNIIGSMFIGLLAARVFDNSIIVGVISGILTFLIILFAEIIPKILGERHSLKISLFASKPLFVITILLHPLVIFLNGLTKVFIDQNHSKNQISEGVIKEMAILGKAEGSINKYESELIKNVFEMDDTELYDVMLPRKKIVTLNIDTNFLDITKIAKDTGFTRFPVMSNEDEIIGLINVKDLFKFHGKESKFSIKKILRPIEFAPEAMKLSTLEQKLRGNRTHMAVIFDEHGSFSGLVTLEDIFEELVGEIEDEFDTQTKLIRKVSPKTYVVDASCEITDLNDKLNLKIDTDSDYSTLNGFLIDEIGKIPAPNDEIFKTKKAHFNIIKVNKKQILSVEIKVR